MTNYGFICNCLSLCSLVEYWNTLRKPELYTTGRQSARMTESERSAPRWPHGCQVFLFFFFFASTHKMHFPHSFSEKLFPVAYGTQGVFLWRWNTDHFPAMVWTGSMEEFIVCNLERSTAALLGCYEIPFRSDASNVILNSTKVCSNSTKNCIRALSRKNEGVSYMLVVAGQVERSWNQSWRKWSLWEGRDTYEVLVITD